MYYNGKLIQLLSSQRAKIVEKPDTVCSKYQTNELVLFAPIQPISSPCNKENNCEKIETVEGTNLGDCTNILYFAI